VTTVAQAVALTAVALTGIAVILVQDPLRQALVNGGFGLTLVILFVALQAPDVAISELVVSTVPVPLVVLAAVARIRHHDKS
jgi:energy-converting hydrogenase B subunit D